MGLDGFLSAPDTALRLSKAAKDALRVGPADVAVVYVTKRAGVTVHPDEVAVVTPDELAEYERRLLARSGPDEIDEFTVERGTVEGV